MIGYQKILATVNRMVNEKDREKKHYENSVEMDRDATAVLACPRMLLARMAAKD